MSLVLEKQAYALPIGDPLAKSLLLAMCHLSYDGKVYANPFTLMSMTGLKERTFRVKRNYLLKNNFLKRKGNNKFIINLKPAAPAGLKPAAPAEKPAANGHKTGSSCRPLYSNRINCNIGEWSKEELTKAKGNLFYRLRDHEGNPQHSNAVERNNPLRAEFFELEKNYKKIQDELDKRLFAAL